MENLSIWLNFLVARDICCKGKCQKSMCDRWSQEEVPHHLELLTWSFLGDWNMKNVNMFKVKYLLVRCMRGTLTLDGGSHELVNHLKAQTTDWSESSSFVARRM